MTNQPTTRSTVANAAPWGSSMVYSRAVRVGSTIEVSGTTSVDPDGQVLHPGDPVAQAKECFVTIRAALEELGSCLEDIVRTRVFVTDVSTWKLVGAAHDSVLGHVAPASSLVGVAALLHPDVVIEIEATAIIGSARQAGESA
jgi:enamine deaminase RidA (YjgF/YER057c/UK114 family)